MQKTITTIFLCLAFFSATVNAGPGHDSKHGHSHGPVSSEVASEKAVKKVKQLVQAGKIDSSWSERQPASVEQKTYSKGPEWVIRFNNDQISETDKQTLYLFYSLDGRYIATNYTGE